MKKGIWYSLYKGEREGIVSLEFCFKISEVEELRYVSFTFWNYQSYKKPITETTFLRLLRKGHNNSWRYTYRICSSILKDRKKYISINNIIYDRLIELTKQLTFYKLYNAL